MDKAVVVCVTVMFYGKWKLYLANIVEREPVKEDIREELPQTEDAIHHPVGQPFSVILLVLALNGFDTGRGWMAEGSHKG